MRPRKIVTQQFYPEVERKYSSALPDLAVFILTAMAIIFFGLVVLYSTSFVMKGTGFFAKQLIWTGIGGGGFAVMLALGYKRVSDWSPLLMLGIFILLCAALCFPAVKGARRWIHMGSFNIQPSEYAKVVIVLFSAWFLAARTRQIESAPFLRVYVPCLGCAGMVIMMVLAGKDLGTTVLLGTVLFSMLFVAGIRLKYILPVLLAVPAILFWLIKKFDPERMARLTTFLDPEAVQEGEGYQLWHSFLALGSGNWFGVGFTESRLKLKYLPEAHTDFILSIVGEELGFVFLLAVLAAYLILVVSGLRISAKARTRQGMLTAFGMVAFLAIQAMINVGVICGAFPTKGMPAPMISYGGSNLVACMSALGCVASVAIDNTYPDYQKNWTNRVRRIWNRIFYKKSTTSETSSGASS